MQIDMFEEPEERKPKVKLSDVQIWERKQEKYKRYISSATWKNKRPAFIELKGGKCEQCGSAYNLEVHHLHYDSLEKEQLKDIEVVCASCHVSADIERAIRRGPRCSHV